MISRYPHTATIIVSVESSDGGGLHDSTEYPTEIVGRFEHKGSSLGGDYSAKFYCAKLDFGPFHLDGHILKFEGRRFVIKHSSIQQTHSEIWLE